MPYHIWHGFNTVYLKYLYCQSQYPKPCIEKSQIPLAQHLEHLACNQGVVGLSLNQEGTIFHFIKFQLFQELFTIEMSAVVCARLAFHMLNFTNKITHRGLPYGIRELCQNWISQWLVICTVSSHYPGHWWLTINGPHPHPLNKLQWNLNQNELIFIQENTIVMGSAKFHPCLGLKSSPLSAAYKEREREIKFIGLFENRGHRGPYSSYKPFNHNLYIGIIIFPNIDNTQYTGYDLPKKKPIKIINGKSEGPINLTNHWRKRLWISLHVDLKRLN